MRPGPEESHEARRMHRIHTIYTRKTRERRFFMEELDNHRDTIRKRKIRQLIIMIGPKWYHVLSELQREALRDLEVSIYKDLLEGRPVRVLRVLTAVGLYAIPNKADLMECVYAGRNDAKRFLAHLFLVLYDHSFDLKRQSYCLNAKLILSSIYYLGADGLMSLLTEKFQPDKVETEPSLAKQIEVLKKPKSPYLQKLVAPCFAYKKKEKFRPAPLPNLDSLNEPFEEPPVLPKPPPPPPPPPPPKKRLPLSLCNKVAEIDPISPFVMPVEPRKTVLRTHHRRPLGSKMTVTETKKTYGLNLNLNKSSKSSRRKPKPPMTDLWNKQFLIQGVYMAHGKKVFVIGPVVNLCPLGDFIHGGHTVVGDQTINIICGIRAFPSPPEPPPCDCMKKWQNKVFDYLKSTKCFCDHLYDFGNEGSFQQEDIAYFRKPTKFSPFEFDFQAIFQTDEKDLHIQKHFKNLWETDSVLQDEKAKDLKKDKKKKKKRSSASCLGDRPTTEDYLRCALRQMYNVNLASRLPDIYRAPELKEWMRRRIHGPLTRHQKAVIIRKSREMNELVINYMVNHKNPRKDPVYAQETNWAHTMELKDRFRKNLKEYKVQVYRAQAKAANIFWSAMYQAQMPDKKFREIYFSYMYARVQDLLLMHPYNSKETSERKDVMYKKRYICPIPGNKRC